MIIDYGLGPIFGDHKISNAMVPLRNLLPNLARVGVQDNVNFEMIGPSLTSVISIRIIQRILGMIGTCKNLNSFFEFFNLAKT